MARFKVGDTVKNFGLTARVVALFSVASDPTHPLTGEPVLREISASGKLRGGKWVADAGKCELVNRGQR